MDAVVDPGVDPVVDAVVDSVVDPEMILGWILSYIVYTYVIHADQQAGRQTGKQAGSQAARQARARVRACPRSCYGSDHPARPSSHPASSRHECFAVGLRSSQSRSRLLRRRSGGAECRNITRVSVEASLGGALALSDASAVAAGHGPGGGQCNVPRLPVEMHCGRRCFMSLAAVAETITWSPKFHSSFAASSRTIATTVLLTGARRGVPQHVLMHPISGARGRVVVRFGELR